MIQRKSVTIICVILACALLAAISESGLVAHIQAQAPDQSIAPQAPLGTAFTYQGQLTDNGSPANGAYDFEFRLYDSLDGGQQVGSTVTIEDASVVDGIFLVELDFGSAFDGTALWLQASVRPGSSAGTYTPLSPRQALTPAPYALHASRAPWDGLTGMPADFADGTDNDTTYSADTGLTLSGGAFSIAATYRLPQGCASSQIAQWNGTSWVCASASNTSYTAGEGLRLDNNAFRVASVPMAGFVNRVLDSSGATGRYPAIIIGLDGLPLISYHDATSGDLEVYHCDDMVCSSGTRSTIDSTGVVGEFSSVTIGRDGYGLISYYDRTNGDLKLAHCKNTACTSADTTVVDSAGDVGQWTSITTTEQGYGFISYYDVSNANLKVVACTNLLCTAQNTWTIDSTGNVGQYTSVARNGREYAYISYYDATNGDLKVARCVSMDCNNLIVNTIDGEDIVNSQEEDVGLWTSIAIAMDSYPLIAYAKASQSGSTSQALVAHCTNAQCSAASVESIISMGSGGPQFQGFSISVGPNGQGLISFAWNTATRVYYAQCTDLACTNTVINDSVVSSGRPRETSLTIGADGLPIFVYYEDTNPFGDGADLRAVHCSDLTCQPYLRQR